jgi:RNA polymerase sigma-70 factor (sigma-E family)
MTGPDRRPLPDKSIEEVARLVEESSLGTAGARQLRDRVAPATTARIRARAYVASNDIGRAWWQANQRNADALRRKARELAIFGNLEISDVLTRLAADQENITHPMNAVTDTPCQAREPEPFDPLQAVLAQQEVAANWRTFEAFYHRETGQLITVLCGRTDLPDALGRELIFDAMVKAFDDWEHLAASGNPAEWVLGYALQLHRKRQLPDEDGSWAPSEDTSTGGALVTSAQSSAVQCTDVRVTGALAAAASLVPLTAIDTAHAADEAVTRLYSMHYRSLVRLAAFLVRDVGTAEEVVQDSFVAMHGRWRWLRDNDSALSYLRQSVVNRSRSVLRHRMIVDRNKPKPSPDMPSAEHGAIVLLERSAVVAALRSLPARQREALVLRYYADLSEPEIATAMGISRGAVKSHTARAMSALRTVLEQGA